MLRSNFDVGEFFVSALESRFLHIQTYLHKLILKNKQKPAYTDFPESDDLEIKCKKVLNKMHIHSKYFKKIF